MLALWSPPLPLPSVRGVPAIDGPIVPHPLDDKRCDVRSLSGKTLFLAGASRDIGLAIAARDGANVVIAAKSVARRYDLMPSNLRPISSFRTSCHPLPAC